LTKINLEKENFKKNRKTKNKNQKKKFVIFYLKLTDACHTKANNKKKIGIIGKTSTIGSKGA
jgi:hypothetical protein